MSTVPCNGCTLCCHGDAIRLLPEDDAALYKTEPHERYPGQLMLAHKPDGDCVYLGEGGCTIQDSKPRMCRDMDCRNIAAGMSYTRARVLGLLPVWERGKVLLRGGR